MINLSPEQEKKLLDEYHAKKAQTEAEYQAINQEREERRKAIEAAMAKRTKVTTTRVPHDCAGCGAMIPAGTEVVAVVKWGNVSRSGYTGGYNTFHYCGKCRPVEEA